MSNQHDGARPEHVDRAEKLLKMRGTGDHYRKVAVERKIRELAPDVHAAATARLSAPVKAPKAPAHVHESGPTSTASHRPPPARATRSRSPAVTTTGGRPPAGTQMEMTTDFAESAPDLLFREYQMGRLPQKMGGTRLGWPLNEDAKSLLRKFDKLGPVAADIGKKRDLLQWEERRPPPATPGRAGARADGDRQAGGKGSRTGRGHQQVRRERARTTRPCGRGDGRAQAVVGLCHGAENCQGAEGSKRRGEAGHGGRSQGKRGPGKGRGAPGSRRDGHRVRREPDQRSDELPRDPQGRRSISPGKSPGFSAWRRLWPRAEGSAGRARQPPRRTSRTSSRVSKSTASAKPRTTSMPPRRPSQPASESSRRRSDASRVASIRC